MIRIACAQLHLTKDMEENYHKALLYLHKAKLAGAQLVCFPEGQLSEYTPQYAGLPKENIAIALDHPYIKGFCHACRNEGIIGVFSLTLTWDAQIYSTMMVIDETGCIKAIARKNHIVRAPHFYEQDYFTPGDDGFIVVPTSAGNIGLIVCFDRHYPESFRTLALKGADVAITAVANETTEPLEIFQWELRIPAFQNSFYTVMVNRTGREGVMDFCGQSLVAAPDGILTALAGVEEELLLANMDYEKSKILRNEKQYLSLRRRDMFEL